MNTWTPRDNEAIRDFSTRFAAASASAETVAKAIKDVGAAMRWAMTGIDLFNDCALASARVGAMIDAYCEPLHMFVRSPAINRKARSRMRRKWHG